MSGHDKKHPYHLIPLSPWPILTAFALLIACVGAVMYFHSYSYSTSVLIIGNLSLVYCLFAWWRDVIKESREEKAHNETVKRGLKIGMGLFIVSEIVFFLVFFASILNYAILPMGVLDGVWVVDEGTWPPEGIHTFNPWDLPFMNTLILLLSGTSITWADYALIENNKKDLASALGYTVILGVLFLLLQAYEYSHAHFGLSDGIYAANFFLATGFHGLHVLIGVIFLFICYMRAKAGHFDAGNNHLGFEFAAWYWHFVDVVWLFLFVLLYIWAS